MGIVSNYIWERATDGGVSPVSLVLQQVKVRGREIGLFCVCTSREETLGGYMTERLVEWFHKVCLPACEKRKLPSLQALLEPELACILRELNVGQAGQQKGAPAQRLGYGGVLLAGSQFFLFVQGEVGVQLVNYRYNRPQLKALSASLSGRIQRGAGLLLHTPELTGQLAPKEVCQILHGEGDWQEQRIGRRLRELYREGRSRGSVDAVGGIYLQIV